VSFERLVRKSADKRKLVGGECNTIRPRYSYPTIYPPPITDKPKSYLRLARLPPVDHMSSARSLQNSIDSEIECCIELFSRMAISEIKPVSLTAKPISVKSVELTPVQTRLRTYSPAPLEVNAKITTQDSRPAPPVLDTSPTLVTSHKPSSNLAALTSSLSSYGIRSGSRNGRQARKMTPFPRRKPSPLRRSSPIPYLVTVGSQTISIGHTSRTLSLTSESSCESNVSSPMHYPITPQLYCADMSGLFPDVPPPPYEYNSPFSGTGEPAMERKLSDMFPFSAGAMLGVRG
jgi:hypothetical protein